MYTLLFKIKGNIFTLYITYFLVYKYVHTLYDPTKCKQSNFFRIHKLF